jgi:membrane-associated phospholipid phosphatase
MRGVNTNRIALAFATCLAVSGPSYASPQETTAAAKRVDTTVPHGGEQDTGEGTLALNGPNANVAETLTGMPFDQQPAPPQPTPRHTGVHQMVKELAVDFKHLPSKENLYWALAGGGLAAAVHPVDDNVNEAFLDTSSGVKHFFKPGAILGQFPTLIAAATTVYVVGRSSDKPHASHTGMDLIRALVVSEAMVQTLKYTTQRTRPDGSSKNSFPSGHAADTFAFATALERHLNWKFVVPAYAIASYVAMSRLPANRHWLSDVVFGSTVGIISGRTVTGHELNKYHVQLVPLPGGIAVTYMR